VAVEMRSERMMQTASRLGTVFFVLGLIVMGTGLLVAFKMNRPKR